MRPRALRSFTVRAELPGSLAALHAVAMNLRWAWDTRSRDLFRWADPDAWEASRHDPMRLLGMLTTERLEALAGDQSFVAFLAEVHDGLQQYLARARWFQGRSGSPLRSLAYFSPEFGIDRSLPQYSGGLGVLAGDHLKAASALGAPLVAVGLLYRHGYFRQELNHEGWQQERYVPQDPWDMPLEPVGGTIPVELAGTPVHARIWQAQVGRIALYLLDTHVDENDEEGRGVTDRLYSGPEEHRLRQEIVLGVGGIRALEAVGESPQVFHINEGHAGLLAMERIRRLVAGEGLRFHEAVETVRASTIFTTHTPVAAGIDRFPRPLMERYFKGMADECGVSFEELMSIGLEPGDPPDAPFNMAVMALRLTGRANGVSRLHGTVSRRLFEHLWPGVPAEEVPIAAITNGVHPHTWVSAEMADLFDRYVLPEWYEADDARWARIEQARDEELWRVREAGRDRLVAFVRRRLKEAGLAKGMSETDLAWCDEVLDPKVLTIGFARRFASYKRPTLLLSQPERLKALLSSASRPVQLIFAGKAHPADDEGKEAIRRIVEFSRSPDLRHRVVFLEDYDIEAARHLYQGADLWLNNPRRPLEACGTSGEKAALNGALNCSILDGWWDELYDGENGWAIASAENHEDMARRDQVEAASMFDILERQAVPLFYERQGDLIPRAWIARVKRSLRTLAPRVSASRMVRDYVEELYEPAAAHVERLSAGGYAGAKRLAAWKQRVRAAWEGVRILSADGDLSVAALGTAHEVEAAVDLGELEPADVEVQLVHGAVNPSGELLPAAARSMQEKGEGPAPGTHRYRGSFVCNAAGHYGFTVRIVPAHPDLVSHAEVGCITWA